MSTSSRPRGARDYRIQGFFYDALVLGAYGHMLAAYEAAVLVEDPDLDAEIAALEALFDARGERVHEVVWWSLIDRVVCTCGLVMGDVIRQDDTVGHLDLLRMRLAGVVVLRTPEGAWAACQHCTGRSEPSDDLAPARAWEREHRCPPRAPAPSPDLGRPRFGRFDREADTTRERYFARRMIDALREIHPRSEG